jgi:hypothetical protein
VKIFIIMTVEEAKYFLSNMGLSSCSCKYGGTEGLIQEAIRLKKLEEQKTPPIKDGV